MSIGGADPGHESGRIPDILPCPGSDGAMLALLDHIAAELALEYIDRMKAAASASCKAKIEAHPSSEGPE
jgi:hypothetical protein